MTAPNKASYIWVYKAKNCLMKGNKNHVLRKHYGLGTHVLYTWICLHTQRPFGECSGKEKRKNRRLLHGGLERRTAHGRHRIPQHVNSKHRTWLRFRRQTNRLKCWPYLCFNITRSAGIPFECILRPPPRFHFPLFSLYMHPYLLWLF